MFIGETGIIVLLVFALIVVYILGQGLWGLILANYRKESVIFEINSNTGRIEIIRAKKFSEGIRTKDNRIYSTDNTYDLARRKVIFVPFGQALNLNLDTSRQINALIRIKNLLGLVYNIDVPKTAQEGLKNLSKISKIVSDEINILQNRGREIKESILNLKRELKRQTNTIQINEINKKILKLENEKDTICNKVQGIIKIIVDTNGIDFKPIQDFLKQTVYLSAESIAGTAIAAREEGRKNAGKNWGSGLLYALIVVGFLIIIAYIIIGNNSGVSECQNALTSCVNTIGNMQNASAVLPAR